MTSNTLTNFSTTTVERDNSLTQPVSMLSKFASKISSYIFRSELERSQAKYRAKQQHNDRKQVQRDIVNTLPIEDKLRLGMYRWMD